MLDKFRLNGQNTLLVLIDFQERLAAAMERRDQVVANSLHLIEAARLLQLPVVLTEQYPKGLGPTLAEIKEALPEYRPVEKVDFNGCQNPGFNQALASLKRSKVVLTGMETHICILQTCLGLMEKGYVVHIVQDAVCSRARENHAVAVEWMRDAGAVITCTETVLFQMLERSGTEAFKILSKRIK